MFLNAEFKVTEAHLKGNIQQAIEEIGPKLRTEIRSHNIDLGVIPMKLMSG